MTPLVLIGVAIGIPVVLFTVLRINASIVFLSLCLGSVLVQFVGQDASTMSLFFSSHVAVNSYVLPLVLLFLPVVFTALVMIRTVRGKVRLLLNILPALALGVVGLLLAIPLSSAGFQGAIVYTQAWQHLQQAQTFIVGTSTIVSLFFLWLQRPKAPEKEGSKHRH